MKPICATGWSGCSAPRHHVSATSERWNRRTRVSTERTGGPLRAVRRREQCCSPSHGEIRDQIRGWATDILSEGPRLSRGTQELEELVFSTFCHWWNCELCNLPVGLMTLLNWTTLPRHVLMWLTCLCLQEVHTWQLIEARSEASASLLGLRVYAHFHSSLRIRLHLAVYEVDRQDGAIFSEALTLPENHPHSHLWTKGGPGEWEVWLFWKRSCAPLLCGRIQISR